ncbi:hypothetical protein AAVH_29048 [Aphelenchoides avenae]|nr:hypothetical protein AAVH_29048 [Aphelenchus avenae]
MAFRLALVALIAASAFARPQAPQVGLQAQGSVQGQTPGGLGGQHGFGGLHGPLQEIYSKLTDAQKQQLQQIFQDQSQTKATIKAKLDQFVSGLSQELQDQIQQVKSQFEQKKQQFVDAINGLQGDAKTFADKLKAIHENEQLTPQQEFQQIQEAVQGASPAVLDQLRQKGLPVGPNANGAGVNVQGNAAPGQFGIQVEGTH